MPNPRPIDFLDLCALKARNVKAWRAAWPCFWPIALHAARHPDAGLVRWEAEDVASDAIQELILRIDSVSSLHHAAALLATIAYSRAIDLARRKSAAKRRLPPPEDFVSANNSVSDDLERAERLIRLHQALEVLDADAKLLVMEKFCEELPYKQLSIRHNIPIDTVGTRIYRALLKVRAALQKPPQ